MSSEQDKNPQAGSSQPDTDDMAETTVLPEDYAVGQEPDDAPESAEDALATAQAAADENWNKYLRAVAELDNLRKRNARELENARKYGVEGLATELLAVADSLQMALATGAQAPAESLLEGGRATLKQLQVAMEKYGVSELFPEGEPFDPELHEAMTMQASDSVEPNTVLTVVQSGYQLNGRLLRPARVIVAKEPG